MNLRNEAGNEINKPVTNRIILNAFISKNYFLALTYFYQDMLRHILYYIILLLLYYFIFLLYYFILYYFIIIILLLYILLLYYFIYIIKNFKYILLMYLNIVMH